MNSQKSAFANAKFVTENGFNGFRSVLPTWPNLFPAYTISYSAATGKPMQNKKKKLFVLLVLLLLLITSLAASLILAYLWFNAIQSDYSNESVKISSNVQSNLFDHDGLIASNNQQSTSFKPNLTNQMQQINQINQQIKHHQLDEQKHFNEQTTHFDKPIDKSNDKSIDKSIDKKQPTSTTRSTTPSSTTVESEVSSNDEDGFGEKENDNHFSNTQSNSNNNEQSPPANKDDEQLINFYKNFKNELDRNRANKANKVHHEEKLDGEFVEHHTLADTSDDDESFNGELSQPNLQPNSNTDLPLQSPPPQISNQNEVPSLMSTENYSNMQQHDLNLPESLSNLRAKQFCNLNQYSMRSNSNSSYDCKSDLNQNLISSYFCNDKFVIVAKINALKETTITQQGANERQLISKYDTHIERILKRSPFLSVAFKKQGLTTNITINLSMLEDELRNLESNAITCLGQRLELKLGQTYLISGRIFGLNAVSTNCDVILEWFNDLDEDQRNSLINWSSRTAFSHC